MLLWVSHFLRLLSLSQGSRLFSEALGQAQREECSLDYFAVSPTFHSLLWTAVFLSSWQCSFRTVHWLSQVCSSAIQLKSKRHLQAGEEGAESLLVRDSMSLGQ